MPLPRHLPDPGRSEPRAVPLPSSGKRVQRRARNTLTILPMVSAAIFSSLSSQDVAMSQPRGSHAAGVRDLGITLKIKRNIGAQLRWCGIFQHPGRSNLSKLLGLCFFSGQPTADPLEKIMGEKLEMEFAESETFTQWQNIHCVFVVNKDVLCNVRHGIHSHVRAYKTRE